MLKRIGLKQIYLRAELFMNSPYGVPHSNSGGSMRFRAIMVASRKIPNSWDDSHPTEKGENYLSRRPRKTTSYNLLAIRGRPFRWCAAPVGSPLTITFCLGQPGPSRFFSRRNFPPRENIPYVRIDTSAMEDYENEKEKAW